MESLYKRKKRKPQVIAAKRASISAWDNTRFSLPPAAGMAGAGAGVAAGAGVGAAAGAGAAAGVIVGFNARA